MKTITLQDVYILATAVWYTLRAGCRIYDPKMVIGWFRPPLLSHLAPNDLEVYNVRTDAWGLLALAALMVLTSGWLVQTTQSLRSAAILADVGHHVLTGVGAWGHYRLATHYNTSMAVGVWGCAALALFGLLAAYYGQAGVRVGGGKGGGKGTPRTRARAKKGL